MWTACNLNLSPDFNMMDNLLPVKPRPQSLINTFPSTMSDHGLQQDCIYHKNPHLHGAKVNNLIVEVGTFCQPGKMAFGKGQPAKQKELISILLRRSEGDETENEFYRNLPFNI